MGIYVARDDKTATAALKLAEFNRPAMDAVLLPGWDILPYDRMSPSPAVASQRCAALARIAQAEPGGRPLLVVTTGSSLIQRVPPRQTMARASFSVVVGELVDDPQAFLGRLQPVGRRVGRPEYRLKRPGHVIIPSVFGPRKPGAPAFPDAGQRWPLSAPGADSASGRTRTRSVYLDRR